jgi:endonuclease G
VRKCFLTMAMVSIFATRHRGVTCSVIGKDDLAVPNAFYKIVLHQDGSKVEALAFILPNNDLRGHELGEYLVSIDEIEALTGLDFFAALPDDIENALESAKAQDIW